VVSAFTQEAADWTCLAHRSSEQPKIHLCDDFRSCCGQASLP
jgi:hypothetical protein